MDVLAEDLNWKAYTNLTVDSSIISITTGTNIISYFRHDRYRGRRG